MDKFRCAYTVHWGFNGIIEVGAKDAYEAEKKADAELGEMAERGEFDDVSDFNAKFDNATVLDVEKVEDEGVEVVKGDLDHAAECRYARDIAALSTKELDGESAAKVVAEAVANCGAHAVLLKGDGVVEFDYDNSFGPTVTVDDVLERMNMRDWRMACDEFCKLMLRKGGLDPEKFDWPTPFPKVMKVPEGDDPMADATDVIAHVCVTFKVDQKTYEALVDCIDRRDGQPDDPDADGKPDATEEEICTNCDHVIRYLPEKGKRVVTCPECGAANPLCNECSPDTKRCSECEVSKMCDRINEMRADNAPETEE